MVIQSSLGNNLSKACPNVAAKIQGNLALDIQYEGPMGYLSTMAKYSQTFPAESPLEADKKVTDHQTKSKLTVLKAINWWTSPCPHVHPLFTPRNTNVAGLCDAVSLAAWGIEDCIIRDTLTKTLSADRRTGSQLFNYWAGTSEKNEATDEQKTKSWQDIVRSVDDVTKPVNEFHVFLVANILRRPIIVLGNDCFSGIYLPMFWPESNTINSPLVISHTAEFSPLIPNTPDIGRDFIPISKYNRSVLKVHFLENNKILQRMNFLNRYLDIQQHSVLVDGASLLLPVARLNLLNLPYDMSIIDNYLEFIMSSHLDMENFVLADRWAQLAIGFPPMDWYLPKQISIYNYANYEADFSYQEPIKTTQNVTSTTNREKFFERPTVKLSDQGKAAEPPKSDLKTRRAAFKRTGTLSDMGPGFGGRRGALIGGSMDTSTSASSSAASNRVIKVGAKPGLGGARMKGSRRGSSGETSLQNAISEVAEEEEPTDEFTKKLKQNYKAPEKDQSMGFVADKATLRAKRLFIKKLSASEFISPS